MELPMELSQCFSREFLNNFSSILKFVLFNVKIIKLHLSSVYYVSSVPIASVTGRKLPLLQNCE